MTMSERKPEVGSDPADVDKPPGLVGDLLKRAVLTGVGALFMTEEGIRNAVGELKLPKDVLAFMLSQAERTRSDLGRVVTAEVRRFLESETLQRQVWKILTGITLEVNATIALKPSGEPGLKVNFKRREGEKPPPAPDDDDEDFEE
jgi:hypothetical protein